MTVQISLGIPDGTYRRLAVRAEMSGVQVKEILARELARAAGELSEFEVWAATLSAKSVKRERMILPMREMQIRLYDAETRHLETELRNIARRAPGGHLDFRADRVEGRENHG